MSTYHVRVRYDKTVTYISTVICLEHMPRNRFVSPLPPSPLLAPLPLLEKKKEERKKGEHLQPPFRFGPRDGFFSFLALLTFQFHVLEVLAYFTPFLKGTGGFVRVNNPPKMRRPPSSSSKRSRRPPLPFSFLFPFPSLSSPKRSEGVLALLPLSLLYQPRAHASHPRRCGLRRVKCQ